MAGKIQLTLEERLLRKISKNSETKCWDWLGYKTKEGFGQLRRPGKKGKLDYAHRISYEIYCSELVDDIKIVQKCRNNSCANPEHLISTFDQSLRKYSDLKTRLLSRIDLSTSGCWEYAGFKNDSNYGRLGYGPRDLGVQYAHIISYEVHFGEIPKGLFVLHKCDNPPCVNPEHLFLGTQNDNIQDAITKGRMWYQQ